MKMYFFSRRVILAISTTGLLLLAFTCAWIFRFQRQTMKPVALAVNAARDSVKVRQLLGEPLLTSRFTRGSLLSSRGDGNADLVIRVRGPLGRGILYEWAQEGSNQWHICSLLFESADGSISIPLVEDSSSHCERE
jgi:hypothetical protein